MKKNFLLIHLFVCLIALLNCGSSASSLGGSEAGNPSDPTTRSLTGQLVDGSASVSSYITSSSCSADTAIAVDSSGTTVSSEVSADCTFDLALPVGKAYALHFVLEDQFVASMIFRNGANLGTSNVFVLSSGSSVIDLGLVQIVSGQAFPEIEPSTECDQDQDGIDDFDDEDDNEDGVSDGEELDCDEDGYLDFYDEEDVECDIVEDSEDNSDEDDSADDSDDDVTED